MKTLTSLTLVAALFVMVGAQSAWAGTRSKKIITTWARIAFQGSDRGGCVKARQKAKLKCRSVYSIFERQNKIAKLKSFRVTSKDYNKKTGVCTVQVECKYEKITKTMQKVIKSGLNKCKTAKKELKKKCNGNHIVTSYYFIKLIRQKNRCTAKARCTFVPLGSHSIFKR